MTATGGGGSSGVRGSGSGGRTRDGAGHVSSETDPVRTRTRCAALGTFAGLFLGLPGLLIGPFAGAVTGELLSHGQVEKATRAGLATWLGLLFGTLAKLALVFTMLGVFAFAYFF